MIRPQAGRHCTSELGGWGQSEMTTKWPERVCNSVLHRDMTQLNDMDSFLVPLHNEAWRLAGGIDAYDCETDTNFKLPAYILTACANMQAVKHLNGMKGPNALSPCRFCKLRGVHYGERRKYDYPLSTPCGVPSPRHRPACYDRSQ